MARRKRKKQKRNYFDDLAPQTKQAIGAVFFTVLGAFFVLSSFEYAGIAGELTHEALTFLFGIGFILAPVTCALYVYVLMKPREDEHASISKAIGVAVLLLSVLGLLTLYNNVGGVGGMILATPLELLFGKIASYIVLGAVFLIGFLLTFNVGFRLPSFHKDQEEKGAGDMEYYEDEIEEEDSEKAEEAPETDTEEKKTIRERIGLKKQDFVVSSFTGTYAPPPLSLLERDRNKAQGGDVKANSNIIKRTLQNFGIEVEMDEIKVGPSVTQYALKPAEGVRISKIVGLKSNLELALAANPIRIEAPIPGKSLVGIEVPNSQKQKIGLASLLASPEYTDSPKPLLVALGKDITGHAIFPDIDKMPHALIAGATGSGKSVVIHNLVASLLFRNSPEQLRFIMIDPKRVELTFYNGIPHLLTPVITDAKKTILALKWAIKEMERRYDILQAEKMQDVSAYHRDIYQPEKKKFIKDGSPEEEADSVPEPLPYIVIIVDELNDLMSAYPRELEALIVRLTQKSRAVGIHLIIATQRPEVKVITGLIKANMPCRIALRVNSQIDSRTILDGPGAETLLGYGDMLYLSPEKPKPLRLQSALVTTDEIKKVVKYLKNQVHEQELDSFDLDEDKKDGNADAFFESMVEDEEDDDLYEDAKATVIVAGKASTSYLQRRLRIGYSRAARLMDILEDRGIIGPQDGSKPREILVGRDADDESDDAYEDEKDQQ